jgi:hypothetical protein
MPVWNALVAFFLDTDLQEEDFQYIARICAASPYSLTELEHIMFTEVWPAFLPNLLAPAGEWAGWPETFVNERILKQYRRRFYFSWRLNPLKRHLCRGYAVVERLVAIHRQRKL